MFHRNTSINRKNYPVGKRKFGINKRLPKSKSRGGKKFSKGQQKRGFKLLVVVPVIGLMGVILFAVYNLFFLSALQKEIAPAPVMLLELTSAPSGATVLLQGQEKGVTPLKLPIMAGTQTLEFRKSGYASYFKELKVESSAQITATHPGGEISALDKTGSSPVSQTPGVITNDSSVAAGSAIITSPSPKAFVTLPAYSFKAELWPAQVALRSFPKPLPGTRLEYARYLNLENIELTYLTPQGETQAPGSEGLPTNLWLYRPAISEQPRPVILSYSTLQSIARYYGIISDTVPITTTTAFLGEMAISGPVVAPEADRVAYVSNRLTKNIVNKTALQKDSSQAPAVPVWDDQAIWISELGEKPSAGGSILTDTETKMGNTPTLPLFSLKDLPDLLPGLAVPANTPAGNYLTGQRFATIQQLSWSPGGDKLLATIEINERFLSGDNRSGNDSAVTVMVLLTLNGRNKGGKAAIVTPQPLSDEVLPGTFVWSPDETAISFLVDSNRTAFSSSAQASLCVLDFSFGTGLTSENNPQNTPLHYLGQLRSAGVWNTANPASSSGMSRNLSGGQISPSSYGSIRYNPFSWLLPGNNENQPDLASTGLYSAPDQQISGSSTTNQLNINNLYVYLGNAAISQLVPFVTATPAGGAKSASAAQIQPKTGSYPYWKLGQSPLYLAVRPVTDEKDKVDQGGGLLGGSSNLTWQLSVESFSLPGSFERSLPEGERILVAPGTTLWWVSERRNPTVLVLPNRGTKAIGSLAPGKLEAAWRPDGKGLLLALPSASSSSNNFEANNLWLATWE